MSNTALFHQFTVGRVRIAAGAVLVRRTITPESRRLGPVTDRAWRDKTGQRIFRGCAIGICEEQAVCSRVQSQRVHFQVAEPLRRIERVRSEHTDVDLVQVRAAYIHADRQCRGCKHIIDRLNFSENLIQRSRDIAGITAVHRKVFSITIFCHRLEQRGRRWPLTGCLRIYFHCVGDDVLITCNGGVDVRRRHEAGKFVGPVSLLPARAQCDGIRVLAKQPLEQRFRRLQRAVIVIGWAVTDVDQNVALATICDRAVVVSCG